MNSPYGMLYRFYYSKAGGHVHVRVFAGAGTFSLGKCGDLCFRANEWEHFREGIERTIGTPRGIGHDIEFIDEVRSPPAIPQALLPAGDGGPL